ncbi:memo-like protein-domain-containing protein [Durotheca rogersii]|uniref:memo-like protein-domain-containing protein n=1 Tax=Durotheca rogersii TaxID=419775 RepID=UPI00221E57F5|nr:memo-like protein-domain-containing protein [Durotheca rogersii]KAI5862995.1 memo-like protein-domain-containing protein [Durotheca rogersii]
MRNRPDRCTRNKVPPVRSGYILVRTSSRDAGQRGRSIFPSYYLPILDIQALPPPLSTARPNPSGAALIPHPAHYPLQDTEASGRCGASTMTLKGTREASHAFSWYDGDAASLSSQLDSFLADVPSSIHDSSLPIPGAKIVIAPHAGYSYSGPCAAWAYKSLDLSRAKRIFVLGPSHTYYLLGCALTKYAKYATPFGDLTVDEDVAQQLRDTGKFQDIPNRSDVDEHSLEMHLPYIYKRLTQTFASEAEYPTIVPVLVGDNSGAQEKEFGEVLAPYLQDPDNAFVVSSDFCHWGTRFSYTAYAPGGDVDQIHSLGRKAPRPTNPPIHESIKQVDHQAMDAIETGDHDKFVDNLRHTKNTVCGRHPIGVVMAALEVLARAGPSEPGKYRFKFVQYQRSSLVEDVHDSSVSYASAYAMV